MISSTHRLIAFFTNNKRFNDPKEYRRTKILVRASLLTSLFSFSYLWISLLYDYWPGVYLMAFNVIGFNVIPFLLRTRLTLTFLGNLYILFGCFAVFAIVVTSGGLSSPTVPWVCSIPVLSMLVVNRQSALVWTIICVTYTIIMGTMDANGYDFPEIYDADSNKIVWITTLIGLTGILYIITLNYDLILTNTNNNLLAKNRILLKNKETIGLKSAQLAQNVEEKKYILEMMSHDLSNKLGIINGMLTTIDKNCTSDDQKEWAEIGLESCRQASGLVKNSLRLVKEENQILEYNIELIPLLETIQTCIHSYLPIAAKKSINITFEPKEKDLHIEADPDYLSQIIENLLSNAVKYSETKTTITMDIRSTTHGISISCKDEGPGIPKEELPLIFSRFSKISVKPSGDESSTGLGLSLVKRYTEMMQGTIQCKSEEKVGTTFILTFPRPDTI